MMERGEDRNLRVRGWCLLIDVEDGAWPDDMGDPKKNPELFMAWSMRQFGPYAFPGGLKRAADHWWTNPKEQRIVPEHRAFIRIRITYIVGTGPDVKVAPLNYDPRSEL